MVKACRKGVDLGRSEELKPMWPSVYHMHRPKRISKSDMRGEVKHSE